MTKIKDIMSCDLETAFPATAVVYTARKMRDAGVGALLVVADDGLVGIITDRDIVVRGLASGQTMDGTTVSELMTAPVYHCLASDDVEDATEIMALHQVRRLPVLDGAGALVGIVSLSDLVRSDKDAGLWALSNVSRPAENSYA